MSIVFLLIQYSCNSACNLGIYFSMFSPRSKCSIAHFGVGVGYSLMWNTGEYVYIEHSFN